MTKGLIEIGQASRRLDDAICEICSHCGDLRMRNNNEDSEEHQGTGSIQTELRYIRGNFNGLKESVDIVLKDHEERLRSLESKIWVAIGGGAVVGWLGSVLIRFLVK